MALGKVTNLNPTSLWKGNKYRPDIDVGAQKWLGSSLEKVEGGSSRGHVGSLRQPKDDGSLVWVAFLSGLPEAVVSFTNKNLSKLVFP